MKRSEIIGKGIYQFEWLDDKIAVVKLDKRPTSTDQWVDICPESTWFKSKYDKFYLEGTNNDDIKVIPVGDML